QAEPADRERQLASWNKSLAVWLLLAELREQRCKWAFEFSDESVQCFSGLWTRRVRCARQNLFWRQHFHAIPVPAESVSDCEFRLSFQCDARTGFERRFDFQRPSDVRAVADRSGERKRRAQRRFELQRDECEFDRAGQLRHGAGAFFFESAAEQDI